MERGIRASSVHARHTSSFFWPLPRTRQAGTSGWGPILHRLSSRTSLEVGMKASRLALTSSVAYVRYGARSPREVAHRQDCQERKEVHQVPGASGRSVHAFVVKW